MIITKRTRTAEVIPFLNKDTLEQLLSQIEPFSLQKPVIQMTLREYFACLDGTYVATLLKEKRAYKAFGMLRQLRTEMDQIAKILKQNKIEEGAEQKQARFGVSFPSSEECILIDVCKFFNLQSLEDAGNVNVAEWLMIYRYQSANNKFEFNYNKIKASQAKLKHGK